MWLLYWGYRLGMSWNEIQVSRIGELLDLIDCHAIAHGAEPKGEKRGFDDILMNVR